MKWDKALSWKFTLPFGIILWLIGKLMGTESIVASAIATAGFIIGLFGLVGLISSFFRKKEQKNI